MKSDHLDIFLGAWMHMFPLCISDVCGLLECETGTLDPDQRKRIMFSPPFYSGIEDMNSVESIQDFEEKWNYFRGRAHAALEDRRLLHSITSSAKGGGHGGTSCTPNEIQFKDILKRYFSEMFPAHVYLRRYSSYDYLFSSHRWIGKRHNDNFHIGAPMVQELGAQQGIHS